MKTLRIDIDGVIFEELPTFERSLAKPLEGYKTINRLKDLGYTIVLETARSWSEYRMTVDQLAKYNIRYDQLIMGKFPSDYSIDDRAIKFNSWKELELELLGGDDSWALYNVRQATKNFIEDRTKYGLAKFPVCLEIAPMIKDEMPFPEFYLEPSLYAVQCYAVGPGREIPDFFQCYSLNPQPTDILAVNVLEHMERVWEFPKHCKTVLKGKGRVHIFVPYNLRFHGPKPDLWRFTDTGLKYLMRDFKCTYIKNYGKENKPYGTGATFEI